MAVWQSNLKATAWIVSAFGAIYFLEKLCCNCNTNIEIAIAMLTLQLQLQQNAIESYIAIEIYFTNTRIFVAASMGSQLAQW